MSPATPSTSRWSPTQPGRGVAGSPAEAYGTLLRGIAHCPGGQQPGHAPAGTGRRRARGNHEEPVETRYDPTMRFAPVDAFISWGLGQVEPYHEAGPTCGSGGSARWRPHRPESPRRHLYPSLHGAGSGRPGSGLVLVGPAGDRSMWRQPEIEEFLTEGAPRVAGAPPRRQPPAAHSGTACNDHLFLQYDPDGNIQRLLDWVTGPLDGPAGDATQVPRAPEAKPVPGCCFEEKDQDVFLGVSPRSRRCSTAEDRCCSVIDRREPARPAPCSPGWFPPTPRAAGSERWPGSLDLPR